MTDTTDDNFLDVSDEEFSKMSAPELVVSGSSDEEEAPEAVTPDEPEDEDTDDSDAVEESSTEDEDKGAPEEQAAQEEDKTASVEKPIKIDYEAEYNKLMSAFKANGTEIAPKSPEDARRLMQMGANYNKKMAGMKPALKALKTLENNGLLDEEKLNFLIDLNKGNPDAIAQLLKDSAIDPLDVDVSTEKTYRPANHSVSDIELELDSVLTDIKSSPNYVKTLNIVSKEWDESSRNQIATTPHIISIINGQMDSGVFDQVMAAVQYDRSVGNLQGVSDFDAYKLTGNRLEQEGAFNKKPTPAIKADPVKELKRQAQRKAAGPTKVTSTKVRSVSPDFNPLDLSDEEFEKFDPKSIGL